MAIINKRFNHDERFQYLTEYLTKEEYDYIYSLTKEYDDYEYYDSYDEAMEENFNILIQFKGYDLLSKKLCVVARYTFSLPEYSYNKYKTLLFDSFEDYYNFFDGDIYGKAMYYGFVFTSDIIDKFNIDLTQINSSLPTTKTISEERSDEHVVKMRSLRYDVAKSANQQLKQCCKVFFDYDCYESMEKALDINMGTFFKAAEYWAPKYPERVFKMIESVRYFISTNLHNFILFHYKDGEMFDSYVRKNPFFNNKTYVTKDTPFNITYNCGFDGDYNVFYKEHCFNNPDDWHRSFKEIFFTIEELAEAMNGDLSNGDFSDCNENIDWSKYNTDNAKIANGPIHRSVEIEYYKDQFNVEYDYIKGNVSIGGRAQTFYSAIDVLSYLQYDIGSSNAEKVLEQLRNGQKVLINIK